VTPFFELENFLTLVLGLMLATGILFLTPIFMGLLSYFGLISPITPDGSGITQLILSFFLAGLYFLGYIMSKVFKKVETKK
jgi:Sec-independent protein secretion pathway component TatC